MYLLNRNPAPPGELHLDDCQFAAGSFFALPAVPRLYLKSFLLIHDYHLGDLLFSKVWKPGSGQFGFYPFIRRARSGSPCWQSSFLRPICLLTAIYVTQYTRKRFLRIMHPAIDILAGNPVRCLRGLGYPGHRAFYFKLPRTLIRVKNPRIQHSCRSPSCCRS